MNPDSLQDARKDEMSPACAESDEGAICQQKSSGLVRVQKPPQQVGSTARSQNSARGNSGSAVSKTPRAEVPGAVCPSANSTCLWGSPVAPVLSDQPQSHVHSPPRPRHTALMLGRNKLCLSCR